MNSSQLVYAILPKYSVDSCRLLTGNRSREYQSWPGMGASTTGKALWHSVMKGEGAQLTSEAGGQITDWKLTLFRGNWLFTGDNKTGNISTLRYMSFGRERFDDLMTCTGG